ncbi:MAG: alpha/beta fold hydrolase [Acidimicrobiales bacterium]
MAGRRTISVRGIEAHISVVGEGDPLLLLNGINRSPGSWEPFVAALPGRTVVVLDSPGVGGPGPVLPLSIRRLADLAAAVLGELAVDRADVLGYSHGGAVAQEMAWRHPDRVRRLVLVSTSCGLGSTPGGWGGFANVARALAGVSGTAVLRALGNALALASWSSIPYLGSLTTPTLVVCGTEDIVTPPANSRTLATRIPHATLALLPGGHDLQRPDAAASLARIVESFLADPLATTTADATAWVGELEDPRRD